MEFYGTIIKTDSYGGHRLFQQRKCQPKDQHRSAGQRYLGRRQDELRRWLVKSVNALDTGIKAAYNAEGNEVWSQVLDMDGNVIEETGNKGMVPFLFQGQYYDCETGLAYNRFRYYSPQMGMYVSQDPIGLAGGIFNLYGYVDDTNSRLDIFGLKKKSKGRKPKYQRIKSTGRTKTADKNEAFVLDFVKKHPENGTVIIESALIGDKAFNGYSKMSQTINGVEIHYMTKIDKNKAITDVADFKIKTNKNVKYRSK